MYAEIHSYRCPRDPCPLVAVTELNIGIIFNTGDARVEDIIIQYLLGVRGLRLANSGKAYKTGEGDEQLFLHDFSTFHFNSMVSF